ncbi:MULTISPECIES: FKBP-type peptidyl-prolyl cis-trans isomerase [Chitinophagaceae]
MTFKKFFSAAAIASCVLAASCLKNGDTPTTQTSYEDPTLEISAIDHFTDSMGLFNMQYDSYLTGFKYEIIERGDTVNNKLSSNNPVGVIKYIGKLMNGTGFDSSYKQTDSVISIDFSTTNVISAWQYVLTYSASTIKIGKGGHIRFVTPSAYAYGSTGYGSVIPANAPLFFDIELKDVKSY